MPTSQGIPSTSCRAMSKTQSRAISGIAEPKKFIAIFPGSGSPTKNWPIEKFLALADRLNEETRAVFILGPAEDSLDAVLHAAGHATIRNQPLGVVAAIARMASAFVGNDSGVSHLAAATGTPGVVLFGRTDPAAMAPARSRHGPASQADRIHRCRRSPHRASAPDVPLKSAQKMVTLTVKNRWRSLDLVTCKER